MSKKHTKPSPTAKSMLEISNCIVTIDAMGTQKEIAKAIIEKEADYVLGLKGNPAFEARDSKRGGMNPS